MNTFLESRAVDYFELAGYVIVFVAAVAVLGRQWLVPRRNELNDKIYVEVVHRWVQPIKQQPRFRIVALAAVNLAASMLGVSAFFADWQLGFHLCWAIMALGGALFINSTLIGGLFRSLKESDFIEHDLALR
jgi:hypothetical protein